MERYEAVEFGHFTGGPNGIIDTVGHELQLVNGEFIKFLYGDGTGLECSINNPGFFDGWIGP